MLEAEPTKAEAPSAAAPEPSPVTKVAAADSPAERESEPATEQPAFVAAPLPVDTAGPADIEEKPAGEPAPADETDAGDREADEPAAEGDASPPGIPAPAFHRMWSSPTPPGEDYED